MTYFSGADIYIIFLLNVTMIIYYLLLVLIWRFHKSKHLIMCSLLCIDI